MNETYSGFDFKQMSELTIMCKVEDGYFVCCQFPDIRIKIQTSIPTFSEREDMIYRIKCAFLEKDIILRTDVTIHLNIHGD